MLSNHVLADPGFMSRDKDLFHEQELEPGNKHGPVASERP
jgi:hypothetical protein